MRRPEHGRSSIEKVVVISVKAGRRGFRSLDMERLEHGPRRRRWLASE
jgi:hypothetical protein